MKAKPWSNVISLHYVCVLKCKNEFGSSIRKVESLNLLLWITCTTKRTHFILFIPFEWAQWVYFRDKKCRVCVVQWNHDFRKSYTFLFLIFECYFLELPTLISWVYSFLWLRGLGLMVTESAALRNICLTSSFF